MGYVLLLIPTSPHYMMCFLSDDLLSLILAFDFFKPLSGCIKIQGVADLLLFKRRKHLRVLSLDRTIIAALATYQS